VVTGDEAHASASKALQLAGFGNDQVVRVPTDECGRVRADAWPDTEGPTLVILQAGNVNTGHSDPFSGIIPRLNRERTWVHIDGAFGLWAQVARIAATRSPVSQGPTHGRPTVTSGSMLPTTAVSSSAATAPRSAGR
jgi:hypothetical protein